jgi:hypothetical protein
MSTFDITSPFHVGYIVADVNVAMDQLSEAIGLTWHPPQVFSLDINQGNERVGFDVTFTYSKEGPVQIEVAEGPAGTMWDVAEYGGPNHNGYWTDDLEGDVDRLTAGGFDLLFSGAGDEPGPQGFAMLRSPWGMRVELIDEVMLPMFETWYSTGTFG